MTINEIEEILLQFAEDIQADIYTQSDLQGRVMAIARQIKEGN